MRLLLVIPNLISYQSFLREVGDTLISEGAEVHLACSPQPLWESNRRDSDGAVVHNIDFPRGMNPLGHFRAARQLNILVERLQPDLVHVHFSAAIFTAALARTSRWPRTIGTFHGVAFPAMKGWKRLLIKASETWSVRRLDAAWVLTSDDREALAAATPQADVRRFPGFGVGCDLDKFAPVDESSRSAARAAARFSPEHTVFAFVGRFVDFKGFALVVRAFLQLAVREPDVRLLLIGARDPLHPTGLSLEEEAALRDSPAVVNAGYRQDVASCLAGADLLVFPSQREGMPVCLMEALAMGVPAITSNGRGCREVVQHEQDGVILSDEHIDTLQSAMHRVARDRTILKKWGREAVSARQRFDRSRFVAEQMRIYREHTTSIESHALAEAV